ncbi:MAG: hypothetical protein AB7F61_09065 [Desulfobulbus sp.]
MNKAFDTYQRLGLADFSPINRVDLNSKGISLTPNGYSHSPVVPGCNPVMTLFPGSAHNATAILGKELQNGNIRLILIHPGNRSTLLTETPPYTVFWATDIAADQATGGNRKG